jgi:hypothetical protein
LHDLIFGAQRRRAPLGLGPHGAKRGTPSGPRIVRPRSQPARVGDCALTLAREGANDR